MPRVRRLYHYALYTCFACKKSKRLLEKSLKEHLYGASCCWTPAKLAQHDQLRGELFSETDFHFRRIAKEIMEISHEDQIPKGELENYQSFMENWRYGLHCLINHFIKFLRDGTASCIEFYWRQNDFGFRKRYHYKRTSQNKVTLGVAFISLAGQ